jgi:hypothetical protein
MAIVTNLYGIKKYTSKNFRRKRLPGLKRDPHRAYRRCAKQAIHCEKGINEKPRLTALDIL